MTEQGRIHARTTVELGVVVTILLSIVGFAFNAGILWARVNGLESRTGKLEIDYNAVHDAQMQGDGKTQGQLATITAQLEAISAQQRDIKQQIAASSKAAGAQ
jgi:hypothetical protein